MTLPRDLFDPSMYLPDITVSSTHYEVSSLIQLLKNYLTWNTDCNCTIYKDTVIKSADIVTHAFKLYKPISWKDVEYPCTILLNVCVSPKGIYIQDLSLKKGEDSPEEDTDTQGTSFQQTRELHLVDVKQQIKDWFRIQNERYNRTPIETPPDGLSILLPKAETTTSTPHISMVQANMQQIVI